MSATICPWVSSAKLCPKKVPMQNSQIVAVICWTPVLMTRGNTGCPLLYLKSSLLQGLQVHGVLYLTLWADTEAVEKACEGIHVGWNDQLSSLVHLLIGQLHIRCTFTCILHEEVRWACIHFFMETSMHYAHKTTERKCL